MICFYPLALYHFFFLSIIHIIVIKSLCFLPSLHYINSRCCSVNIWPTAVPLSVQFIASDLFHSRCFGFFSVFFHGFFFDLIFFFFLLFLYLLAGKSWQSASLVPYVAETAQSQCDRWVTFCPPCIRPRPVPIVTTRSHFVPSCQSQPSPQCDDLVALCQSLPCHSQPRPQYDN